MQPVWLCIFSGRPFANAPWGKARRFEDSFEKSLNKCNQRNFASYRVDHLQMHSGEKSNKCNQCDFASSIWGEKLYKKWRKVIQLQPMWICSHLCNRMQANATSVNFPFFRQVIWGDIWKHTVDTNKTNATNVIMHPLRQNIYEYICKHTLGKSQMQMAWPKAKWNDVTLHLLWQAIWGHIWKCTVQKSQRDAAN